MFTVRALGSNVVTDLRGQKMENANMVARDHISTEPAPMDFPYPVEVALFFLPAFFVLAYAVVRSWGWSGDSFWYTMAGNLNVSIVLCAVLAMFGIFTPSRWLRLVLIPLVGSLVTIIVALLFTHALKLVL